MSVVSTYSCAVKSTLGRASRKWALLDPARVAYSGSARCSTYVGNAQRIDAIGPDRFALHLPPQIADQALPCLLAAAGDVFEIRSRSTLSCAATSATARIHSELADRVEQLLARARMVAGDRGHCGPVDALGHHALRSVGALLAQAFLVADARLGPEPIEQRFAFRVEAFDTEHGDVTVLGVDPCECRIGSAGESQAQASSSGSPATPIARGRRRAASVMLDRSSSTNRSSASTSASRG